MPGMLARRPPGRSHRALRRAAVVLAVVAVVAAVSGLATAGVSAPELLFLAPGFLIAAVLAWGTYPGEELLASRRPMRAWRRVAATLATPRRRTVVPPRGGRLVASRLAGRAPPRSAFLPA